MAARRRGVGRSDRVDGHDDEQHAQTDRHEQADEARSVVVSPSAPPAMSPATFRRSRADLLHTWSWNLYFTSGYGPANRHTERRTHRPLHRPCTAYYAASINEANGALQTPPGTPFTMDSSSLGVHEATNTTQQGR